MSVVIVEDDREFFSAVVELVQAIGFQVFGVSSIYQLISWIPLPPSSCVLADVFLDGSSSLDLPDFFKARDTECPVLFMTAVEGDEVMRQAKKVSGCPCLRKHFERDDLFEALDAALSRLERSRCRSAPKAFQNTSKALTEAS